MPNPQDNSLQQYLDYATSYAKRKAADAKRREYVQSEYVEDFLGAVVAFLDFHPEHADLGQQLDQVRARLHLLLPPEDVREVESTRQFGSRDESADVRSRGEHAAVP